MNGEPVDPSTKKAAAEGTGVRRPYVAPRLQVLGSVRDLTYGTGATIMPDFTGGMVPGNFM